MLHPVVLIAIVIAVVLIYAKFKLQWALNRELGLLTPEQQSTWFLHRKPSRKMLGLLFLGALAIVSVLYFIMPPSFLSGAVAYLIFLAAVLAFAWVERGRLLGVVRAEQFPESFQRAAARTKNLEVAVLTGVMVLMAMFFLRGPGQ